MDFDLKFYIPLVGTFITSIVALTIGIVNRRTTIKIRNQQILINILEKDISQIIEVQSYLLSVSQNYFI